MYFKPDKVHYRHYVHSVTCFRCRYFDINSSKTKEMVLGPFGKESPTPLLIVAKPVHNINFGRHRQLDDEVG